MLCGKCKVNIQTKNIGLIAPDENNTTVISNNRLKQTQTSFFHNLIKIPEGNTVVYHDACLMEIAQKNGYNMTLADLKTHLILTDNLNLSM